MGKAPEQQKTETGPWKPYEPMYKFLGNELMNEYMNDKPRAWGVVPEKEKGGNWKGAYGNPKPTVVNPDTQQPDRDTLGNPRNGAGYNQFRR